MTHTGGKWLCTTILLISLPFGVLMFMLPIIGRDMGATALEIGGLYSVFALVTVLLRPIVGRALDRFGRKPFLLAGLAIYSLANLLYATVNGIGILYVARFAQGIGSSLTWLAAYAIVADLASESERGGLFGQVEEMSSRGGILGAVLILTLAGFLGDAAGWRTSFYLFTAIGLLAVIVAWKHVPETRIQSQTPLSAAQHDRLHTRSVLQAVLTRPFLTLMGIVFLSASAYALTSPILMLYLRDHVADNIQSLALAFLPASLIYATLPSRLGALTDRWGRRLPMFVALAIAGGVSMMIPQLHTLWPLIVLWAIESVCFSMVTPAEEALVSDLALKTDRGLAYGVYTAVAGLGAVVGPLLGGWLYGASGEASPFVANAGLLWLAALGVLLVLRIPIVRRASLVRHKSRQQQR